MNSKDTLGIIKESLFIFGDKTNVIIKAKIPIFLLVESFVRKFIRAFYQFKLYCFLIKASGLSLREATGQEVKSLPL
jgi:hypothetical protein